MQPLKEHSAPDSRAKEGRKGSISLSKGSRGPIYGESREIGAWMRERKITCSVARQYPRRPAVVYPGFSVRRGIIANQLRPSISIRWVFQRARCNVGLITGRAVGHGDKIGSGDWSVE